MLVPAGWAGAALWTLIAGVVIATALSSLPTGCTHSPEAEWVARWSDATVVLVGWREVWKTAVSTSMWGVPLGWHQLCRGWLRLRWMTWPLESWLKFVFSNIFLPRHSKTQTFQTRLCPDSANLHQGVSTKAGPRYESRFPDSDLDVSCLLDCT